MIIAISEQRNITKASEKLNISQPAISYRVKLLEDELGAKILIRTSGGVTLTPEGEHFLEYSKEMYLQYLKLREEMTSFRGQVKGPIRIGSSSIFSNYRLPELLKGFHELYPETEIFLKTGMSQQVEQMLEQEDVTVAIIRGDPDWKYSKHLLFDEPICLVSKKPLHVEDLPSLPRITYKTDISMQRLMVKWWRERFAVPYKESMVVDTLDICRHMVQRNLGWALMPSMGLEEFDTLNFQPLSWLDGTPVIRKTWICFGPYAKELPAARAFIDYVISTCTAGRTGIGVEPAQLKY